MKTCVRYCWAALLLAAMVVPVAGNGAKSAARSNSRKTTANPAIQVANGFPTPWPKKPGSGEVVLPTGVQVANGFPTPWPKKPGSVEVVVPSGVQVANGFPTPWPKKPVSA